MSSRSLTDPFRAKPNWLQEIQHVHPDSLRYPDRGLRCAVSPPFTLPFRVCHLSASAFTWVTTYMADRFRSRTDTTYLIPFLLHRHLIVTANPIKTKGGASARATRYPEHRNGEVEAGEQTIDTELPQLHGSFVHASAAFVSSRRFAACGQADAFPRSTARALGSEQTLPSGVGCKPHHKTV